MYVLYPMVSASASGPRPGTTRRVGSMANILRQPVLLAFSGLSNGMSAIFDKTTISTMLTDF